MADRRLKLHRTPGGATVTSPYGTVTGTNAQAIHHYLLAHRRMRRERLRRMRTLYGRRHGRG